MNRIDPQQLSQLVATHGGALQLYARQWYHTPEDALQDALVDLLRQTPAPTHPVAWLFVTVRRRAMNLARGEQRRAHHQRQAAEACEPWFLAAEDQELTNLELEKMLGQLPPLEREIVVARIWGELSLEQIATLVDRSTSVVHRRYQRALTRLGQLTPNILDKSR